MPVSPDLAVSLAKAMLDLYGEAETRLLALIARRLAVGIDAPTWAERQLISVQLVRQETRKLADQLGVETGSVLETIIRTAWNRGAALACADLRTIGEHKAIAFGGINLHAVRALLDTAHDTLTPIGLRIQSQAPTIYSSIVQAVAGQMLAGTFTRRQAAAQAVTVWAGRGITGFTDRAGRNWTMSSYAEMVTRTAASQAIIQGHVEQLAQAGFDLVSVSTAPEPCPLCAPFEGRILSVKGHTAVGRHNVRGQEFTVTATLAEATRRGLFHVNCRHRTQVWSPSFPSVPDHPEPDPDGYKQRQEQRAWERSIRALKLRVAALEPLDPDAAARERAKLRVKTAAFRQWVRDNDRKWLPARLTV